MRLRLDRFPAFTLIDPAYRYPLDTTEEEILRSGRGPVRIGEKENVRPFACGTRLVGCGAHGDGFLAYGAGKFTRGGEEAKCP